MNVGIFKGVTGGARRFQNCFQQYADELRLIEFPCAPSANNLSLPGKAGCEALIYFSSEQEPEPWFQKIAGSGVKYLCTPSTGYDHFNLTAMQKFGLKGANVPGYSPNAISEHTILLLLAVLRNLRKQILNIEHMDFTKRGLIGRQLCDLKIGVIGTGKIGAATIKCLTGFAPASIYAYGHHINPSVKELAQYVSLDELYQNSDVIIFHCSYNDNNHHMVNADSIRRMKDGVILINTARGALFDTLAIARAVESGKISGLGMDVIEGEELLRGTSVDPDTFPVSTLREMQTNHNVIFTNHTAFYTEHAFRELTEITVSNLLSYKRTGACKNEVVSLNHGEKAKGKLP